MTSTPAPRGGLLATVVSAVIGGLALVTCLAVLALTDDLVVATPTGAGGSTVPGLPGSPGGSGGGDGTVRPVPALPDPAACSEKTCPMVGPPTAPAGAFPYPPGTTEPEWTDDFCADTQTLFPEVRQVRMSLTEVRDWYLTHLLPAGYGWGGYGPIEANPFRVDDAGNEVLLGWDGSLTTRDEGRSGRLALEREDGGQTVCGPPPGAVFIQVDLP